MYSVVNDIDDTAHGTPTVQQGGGSADNLDALDQQRIEGHGVIGAEDGCVYRAYTIGEHPKAISAEPTNDRAAGSRAEVSGTDARLTGKKFAKGARLIEQQLATGENAGWLSNISLMAPVRRRRDHERFEMNGVIGGTIVAVGRSGLRGREGGAEQKK